MAALTANRRQPPVVPFLSGEGASYREFPVAASTVIYKGGFVGLDTAGNLVMYAPPTVGTTVVGGFRFVGIAAEAVASQTTAGDKWCSVMTDGIFRHTITSSDLTSIGKPVWASDSAVLGFAALGNALVGHVVGFITKDGVDECIVKLAGFQPTIAGAVAAWSPIFSLTTADIVTVIPKSWNANGLYISRAYMICTTNATASAVVTLQDTAGTVTGVTFTTGAAIVAGDKIIDVGSLQTAADSAAVGASGATTGALVAAGLGINAKTTTTQAAGAVKVWVECIPAV